MYFSGVSRTVKRLQMNYRWKHLKNDVKKYIKSCNVCQKNKSHIKTKQPMLITSTVTKTFERICLDIVGPTTGGNMYILTLQDELSRYALAITNSKLVQISLREVARKTSKSGGHWTICVLTILNTLCKTNLCKNHVHLRNIHGPWL
jgi:hypothetical protein